jgi:hypothetical protein
MIKVQPAITQMNNGHIAPIIEGRTDIQVYGYSCRQAENAIPLVYGANKNRGGTLYVASTKDPTKKSTLIPFKVGQNVAYQLEFGDRYIRVLRNHELVLVGNNPYEIESPYSYEDLYDENGIFQIDYKQSGDILYLAHDKYYTQKLERFGETDWRIAYVAFSNGPWMDRNTDETKRIYSTATTGNVTLNIGAFNVENPFFESQDLGTSSLYNRYFKFLLDNTPYPQDRYYFGSDGSTVAKHIVQALNSCQSDLLAQTDYGNQLKVTAVNNQNNFSLKNFTIIGYNNNYQELWRGNFTFSQYNVSGTTPTFTPDMVNRRIRIKSIEAYTPWYSGRTDVAVGTICVSDNKYYQALVAGTCGNIKPIHEEGIESDGKISWRYLGDGYGIVKITSYISNTSVTGTVEKALMPSLTNPAQASWRWEMELIGLDGIYPSSVDFFKDRLVLGINAKTGPQLVFSKTGDYENFEDITFNEVLSDNAITLPILTDLNKIQWLCSLDKLFVGTEGSIIMVKPMTENDVFGPNNITYDEISNIGTCRIKPVRIGDDILYLSRTTKDVYAIAYNFQSDSYEPDEVSLSAYDLLDNGVTSWTLQYEPNRIVWIVRRDGKLVGFTYNKKQSVRAFHLHSTQGEFESISCIPSPDGTQDEVWFITKRILGQGGQSRNVEYMHNGIPLDIPSEKYEDKHELHDYMLRNCVYLDNAKKYHFVTPSNTITGLSNLEGLEVGVLADGVYVGKKTVENGQIVINAPATDVVVGLSYTTIVEPMPINVDMPNGSGQARSQRINQVVVRLYRTASFEYSWGKEFHKAPVKDEDTLDLMSGDLLLSWGDSNTEVKLNNEDIVNSTGSRMIFRQTEPLPVYFVSIYPQLEVSNG